MNNKQQHQQHQQTLADVKDPQEGQLWFVRDTDNSWYLATVKQLKGVLVDIVYADGTPERFNIKRHAKDIALAPNNVKLTAKAFTTNQVKQLTSEDHEDVDKDWLEVSQVDASQAERLKYIRKQWQTHNKNLFYGRMDLPNLGMLRQTTNKIRGLGVWIYITNDPASGTLKLSPRVFLAGYKQFYETLVHEMCHQYCNQVLGLHKEGHGPRWKAQMIRVGLDPNRTTRVDDTVALDDDELETKQIKIDNAAKALAKYGAIKEVVIGMTANWADLKTGQISSCVVAARTILKGRVAYACVFDPLGTGYKTVSAEGLLHTEHMYSQYQHIPAFAAFRDKVEAVQRHYQRQHQQQQRPKISQEPY